MGALSRRKGHDHERWLAARLREEFPKATVRRSLQSHRAFEPDVVVEGNAPEMVRRLWMECECGRRPDPRGKLEQAERDISKVTAGPGWLIPVAIWREHGKHTTWVTMRAGNLLQVCYAAIIYGPLPERDLHQQHNWTVVTLDFEDFMKLLKVAK